MHSVVQTQRSYSSHKYERGFNALRCPRERFLDLFPFGPLQGSSTCDRQNLDDVNFDDLLSIANDNSDEEENDDLLDKYGKNLASLQYKSVNRGAEACIGYLTPLFTLDNILQSYFNISIF